VSPGHWSTTFAGNVNVGGVVSITVIICIAVATLPQPSAALHVRETIFVPPQLLLTESLKVTAVALHVSVTVGTPVALVLVFPGHSNVKSGGATIVGGVVSRMVIN
jgi:predicted RecA/RadA family phage recombinase